MSGTVAGPEPSPTWPEVGKRYVFRLLTGDVLAGKVELIRWDTRREKVVSIDSISQKTERLGPVTYIDPKTLVLRYASLNDSERPFSLLTLRWEAIAWFGEEGD